MPRSQLPPRRDAGAAGPVDRSLGLAAPIAALFGTLALLAVFVFWSSDASGAVLPYFAVPGVLYAVAGLLAYRAWARPWTRSGGGRRHAPPRR